LTHQKPKEAIPRIIVPKGKMIKAARTTRPEVVMDETGADSDISSLINA
jgi:hypothetical protein